MCRMGNPVIHIKEQVVETEKLLRSRNIGAACYKSLAVATENVLVTPNYTKRYKQAYAILGSLGALDKM